VGGKLKTRQPPLDGRITIRDAALVPDERTLEVDQPEDLIARLREYRKRDWDRRVQHHPPRSAAVIDAHERARALIGQVGHDLMETVPACPLVDRILDTLSDALMLANQAIALHHPDNE